MPPPEYEEGKITANEAKPVFVTPGLRKNKNLVAQDNKGFKDIKLTYRTAGHWMKL